MPDASVPLNGPGDIGAWAILCPLCAAGIGAAGSSTKSYGVGAPAAATGDDYYATIIRQRGDAEAASLLADHCRKKDGAILALNARAEKAEARVAAGLALADEWDAEADKDSKEARRLTAQDRVEEMAWVQDLQQRTRKLRAALGGGANA